MIIAIDGPSGSGKSTISDMLAKELNFIHIDTGSMFRAITFLALHNGISVYDDNALVKLLKENKIEYIFENDKANVYIAGLNVTSKLHSSIIDKNVTPVCKHKIVREEMLLQQRALANNGNYILDGRDIGTVVFPNANFKFYLTASVEIRAKRRYKEQKAFDKNLVYNDVLNDIIRRDNDDTKRKYAPLKKADDAIEIDTTNLAIKDVVKTIINYISINLDL